ncbi:hypothetical protein [Nostoc sp. DSM 114160]
MKINRRRRTKVLTQSEIQLIFSYGLDDNRNAESNRVACLLIHLVLREREGRSRLGTYAATTCIYACFSLAKCWGE